MDDILRCPICSNKLRSSHRSNYLLHPVGKTADYTSRTCSTGHSHVVVLWTDRTTKQVDLLKISLKPNYSRFVEIDYVNRRCRVTCLKDGNYEYIEIPKMIEPDFPDLVKLKERVGLYVLFS